ncbi:amidohydrolase family protein [Zavarzinella formosa]|uniref:amidohydrolase family protein n=1 Tax=Zavarzinella formosa TaxID=360055 RepID=UPI0002F70A3E|nr:amidohydrolase family protein [Zavarzinella formosa]
MHGDNLRIPLLRDRHTHPLLYAALHEGINLNDESADPAWTNDELRNHTILRIREHARRGLTGWAVAQGWNSGRYSLAKEEFDDLPPLVIFNLSLHDFVVNDAGRMLLRQNDSEVAANLDDPNWVERNLRRILNVFANEGASPERLRRFFSWLLVTHGVFHAEEMLLVDEREIRLFEEAGLVGRTRFWAAPEQYEKLSPDIQQKIHGIKMFTDGALGAWTAALNRPYRESPHLGSYPQGMLMYESDELIGILRRYLGTGKPIALHAIGDHAIDQVVAAVEAAGRPDLGEIRIEHAQLISESSARRAKALGILLCMQPNFSDDSVHYDKRLPEKYPGMNNPFRMLIDRVGYVPGKDLLFGSDGMPHGFREGLRQSLFPRYESQSLTVDEFVAGYCMPDDGNGRIEVRIDPNDRSVSGRVVIG